MAADEEVGAAYEGVFNNTGPELVRLNERGSRSGTALETVSNTEYALSERESDERWRGELRDTGDGGFLSSLGSIASSGGVGGVYD